MADIKLTEKEIYDKIKELKKQIAYNEKKLKCCAYGKSDLMYLESLKNELEELEELLNEM